MRALKGEQALTLPAGDVVLEAGLLPGSGQGGALVCHPHPVLGGNMDNKVVIHLVRGLNAAAFTTLRFNFRGVGQSTGEWDEGRGEVGDAAHALSALKARVVGDELVVGGYSFGSYAGLKAAHRVQDVTRLIAVAPPLQMFDFSFLETGGVPLLIVVGEADPICPPDAAAAFAVRRGQAEVVICPGVDHFFHGAGPQIRATVAEFTS